MAQLLAERRQREEREDHEVAQLEAELNEKARNLGPRLMQISCIRQRQVAQYLRSEAAAANVSFASSGTTATSGGSRSRRRIVINDTPRIHYFQKDPSLHYKKSEAYGTRPEA